VTILDGRGINERQRSKNEKRKQKDNKHFAGRKKNRERRAIREKS